MTTHQQGNGTSLIVRGAEPETQMVRSSDVADGLSFSDLCAMGEKLVKTGFLPEHIRTGPQVAAIIMTGRELGMSAMRAVRSLHLVKGKVIEDAASQLSRFKACGGRAKFTALDETKAVLWLRHPNGDEHTETFTIDDAKRAQLAGGNWSKHPKAMLRSRAITSGLKSIGWEGAIGAYDPDEARSFADETSSQEGAAVEHRPVVTESRPADVESIKRACTAEMERLKVGDGLDRHDKHAAMGACAKRLNNGVMPATAEQWSAVLAALKAEPDPQFDDETREPGSDDDKE